MDIPPTQRLPSARLAAMLADSRRRTIALTRDLPPETQLGPELDTVNPPL